MNTKPQATAKAKLTAHQKLVSYIDAKAPPKVAEMASKLLLTGLFGLSLSIISFTNNLFVLAQQPLLTISSILMTASFALIAGAKLQRVHYRLDK